MLDSRSLRYFLAVARELHFGRAAEHLQIAQSALSRHVQELERKLGVRLLNRGRRSVVALTDAGKALLAEAELAMQQLDRAEATVRRAARGEVGRIEIGYVVSAVLSGVLPHALQRFRAARPDVQVQLTAMETPRQLEALRAGLLDVGFVRPRRTYPADVTATVIHREPLLLACASDHPLTSRRIDLAALAHESFIVPQFDELAGFAEHLAALAARGGFEARLVYRVRDFIAAATMAAAGYGVVLAPRSMASMTLSNVVCKPIHGYEGYAELAIAHRTSALSAAARVFIDAAIRQEEPVRMKAQRGRTGVRRRT
jgi:LysR family transcriptional regulator, benzoate and cis,cis-muconate-responsive activator of ben and cat genes